MKKYLQFIVVIVAFFSLVFLKDYFRDEPENIPVKKSAPKPPVTPTSEPTSQQSNTPFPSQVPSTATTTPTSSPTPKSGFKDGSYTGSVEDAFYGYIQVKAIISGGMLADIEFLQYPNDNRTSRGINEEALPILKSEAISAQSAQVDMVSGASDSSPAFIRSLSNALGQAKQ